MALCDGLTGVPETCDDNNLGSFKRGLIASFEDVTDFSPTDAADPDTDNEISSITMASGTKFEEFPVLKDTSQFGETMNVDLQADTHSYNQTAEFGLRRFSLRKRNALSLLAKSRRNLAVIIEDNNGDYWALGFTQGARLTADESTSNGERGAGQAVNFTLTSENETEKMYKVDSTIINALLTAAA